MSNLDYYRDRDAVPFKSLEGEKILNVVVHGATLEDPKHAFQIDFHLDGGRVLEMFHRQDCCENVEIEEVHGDLEDLIGQVVKYAEESSQECADPYYESATWTFYRIMTGEYARVVLRWLGSSNGYYGEKVHCYWRGDEA